MRPREERVLQQIVRGGPGGRIVRQTEAEKVVAAVIQNGWQRWQRGIGPDGKDGGHRLQCGPLQWRASKQTRTCEWFVNTQRQAVRLHLPKYKTIFSFVT